MHQNDSAKGENEYLLAASIDPIRNDIDTALRAWLAFGGLGGRTRRGCGAVHARSIVGDVPKFSGTGSLSARRRTPP